MCSGDKDSTLRPRPSPLLPLSSLCCAQGPVRSLLPCRKARMRPSAKATEGEGVSGWAASRPSNTRLAPSLLHQLALPVGRAARPRGCPSPWSFALASLSPLLPARPRGRQPTTHAAGLPPQASSAQPPVPHASSRLIRAAARRGDLVAGLYLRAVRRAPRRHRLHHPPRRPARPARLGRPELQACARRTRVSRPRVGRRRGSRPGSTVLQPWVPAESRPGSPARAAP